MAKKATKEIQKLDANADGHVTKQELEDAAAVDAKAAKTRDRLITLFQKYDKDGDGTISKSEFKQYFIALGRNHKNAPSEVELEMAVYSADRDHNGKIDFEEFVSWLTGVDTAGRGGHALQTAQGEAFKKEKELRGPERFFYDKTTYTGVHQHGGPSTIDASHNLMDQCRTKSSGVNQRDGSNSTGVGQCPSKSNGVTSQKERSTGATVNISSEDTVGSKVDHKPHATRNVDHGVHERHARIMKADAPRVDEDESDWNLLLTQFTAFAGQDMDGTEFRKLCLGCELCDKKFKKEEIDTVFAKVCEKGKRRIDFETFKNALRIVAMKKGCAVKDVQELVSRSYGPVLNATKTESVRLHDDRNLYTGIHYGT